MEDEQPISFVGTTAGDSETETVHEFEHDGVITNAKVVTHLGQQYALQQYAYLIRDGTRMPLWKPLDKEFLAGDGQVYDLPVRFEFSHGDKLELRAENVNQDGHQYHHNMTINIDNETGVFERITNALRRVL